MKKKKCIRVGHELSSSRRMLLRTCVALVSVVVTALHLEAQSSPLLNGKPTHNFGSEDRQGTSPSLPQSPTAASLSQGSELGPPVYVEGMFGNDRFDLQTTISKRFSQTSKGGLLSITSAQGRYNNDNSSFDFVNITQINYEVYKGLSPTLGVALNRQIGFEVSSGLQYLYTRPSLLVVVAPSVFLTGSHDVQNVLVVLYQPKISHNWRFYGNMQVVDDYIVSANLNARSLAHMRAGFTRGRLTLGVAGDVDWYGSPSDFRTNIGPFVGYSF